MRLARKITLTITAAILVIMAAHAYFLVRNQVILFDADLARSVNLKRALRASVMRVWEAYGDADAQHLVEQTISDAIEGSHVRWTWLDIKDTKHPRYLDLPENQRKQLEAGERVIVFRKDDGETLNRYTYVPLPEKRSGENQPEPKRVAVLEFVESIGEQHAFIEASRLQIALATAGILLACALVVHWLGLRYVGRPIQRLQDRLRAVANGDFDSHVALRQHDEIGDLAREIDVMCSGLAEARLQLAAETEARMTTLEHLRHTDRLTTIGQLAAGVAHELGTPLSVITGRAEMIVSGEATGERATASARAILEQSNQMAVLIRQLLDFSRHRGPRFGLMSVRAVCARTVDTLSVVARRRGITITIELGDAPLLVSADEHQIQQTLVNLLMNAMQAMPDGGQIEVAIGGRHLRPPGEGGSAGDYVCVTVSDHGPGIPPENLSRLFEPFFTTKDPGEGTGLGLSVAHGIVRDHGGWIDVESKLGQGTSFVIWLPAATEAQTPPHRAA